MCNATVALEIAIRALGLHGEVIVPSFTFVATAHALQWQEITPVFCDVTRPPTTWDPARGGGADHPAHQRPHRRPRLGATLRGRGLAGDRPAPRPQIDVRRGPRLWQLASGAHDRQLRPSRGLQLPRHQVLQHLRGGAVVTNDDDLAAKIA